MTIISVTSNIIAVELAPTLVIAITALLALYISYLSYRTSKEMQEFAKITRDEENRPGVKLVGLILDKRAEIYVGDKVSWKDNALPIIKYINKNPNEVEIIYDYSKYIFDKDRLNNSTMLYREDNDIEYLFLNFCPKDILEIPEKDKVALVFNALNLNFKFSNDQFSEMRVVAAYTLSHKTNLCDGVGLNIFFSINGNSSLEIPIALACPVIGKFSINIIEIRDYINNPEKEEINFLRQRAKAYTYMGFTDTAYVFKFKTINDKTYYYTLHLKTDEHGRLTKTKMHNGYDLFKEVSQEAKKNLKHKDAENLIKYYEDYKTLIEGNEQENKSYKKLLRSSKEIYKPNRVKK